MLLRKNSTENDYENGEEEHQCKTETRLHTQKVAALDRRRKRGEPDALTLLASGSRQVCELLESETAFGDTTIGARTAGDLPRLRETAEENLKSPATSDDDAAERFRFEDLEKPTAPDPTPAGLLDEESTVPTTRGATLEIPLAAIAIGDLLSIAPLPSLPFPSLCGSCENELVAAAARGVSF